MRPHRSSRSRSRSARAAALLAAALVAAPAAGQGDYDRGATVVLDQVLPESLIASGQHRVSGARRVGQHTLEFDIESEAAGVQSARSIPLAVVRIQEAQTLTQAMSQFRSDTRQQAEETRGQIQVGGDSLVDIIGSPLDTSAKVVGQFGRNVGQTFEELGQFPGPDARDERGGGATAADPIFVSHRRSVAGALKLDPYSSNPAVQRFLDAMARARIGGLPRAGITTVSVPRPPEVVVAGGRLEERIRSDMLNEEHGELFERDAARLREAGVSDALAARLLAHDVLTPTHKISIAEYVTFLEGADNRGALVEAALAAQDEVEALAKVQLARMYAHYHESWTPLASLVPAGHLALAVTRDNAVVMALPFDILEWTPDNERVFVSLAQFAARKSATSRVVLLTGVATPRARAGLEARGFQVHERFLFKR